MTVTISVYDELAQRLRVAASKQSVSVQELALTILDDAVPSVPPDESWGQRNQRRLELIRKSTRGELSEQEQSQLEQLQAWLDENFQTFDAGLLKQLDEMKQAVLQVPREASNG